MKTYSSAITAYREARKAHGQIDFFSFKVKDKDDPDLLTWVHLCTDDENMTVTVIDPDTGLEDERTFAGGGHIVEVGELTRSEGVNIRSHTIVLSGASDTVLDMVFGFNCREAPVQWFMGDIDQDTGLLVDAPSIEFLGLVDMIDTSDGALAFNGGDGADSTVPVSVNSIGAALLAKNHDMRSFDVSKGRSGDKFFQYSSNAHHWRVWWGKEKKSERDRKGGGRKGHKGDNGHHGGKRG